MYYVSTMPPAKSDAALPLDPTLEFLRSLWRIEHSLQRVSKRMEATVGVTGPQRLVIRVLTAHPNLTAGELSAVVRLHASTLTGVLQRLERKGLIARDRDPADNRRVRLRLLPTARRLAVNTKGTVEGAVAEALSHQSPAHIKVAHQVLSAIAHGLETQSTR